MLRKLGMVAKRAERDRRPTKAELDRLLEHFFEMQQRRPSSINMPKVLAFARFSSRRQEEITRIRWEDLDERRQAVLVRDMKNPGQKVGNDMWCTCQTKVGPFSIACRAAALKFFPTTGIRSLLHGPGQANSWELRICTSMICATDGISRLFEMGWDIPVWPVYRDIATGTRCAATRTCMGGVTRARDGLGWRRSSPCLLL
ncbi:hypothetical protein D3C78_858130 [compost metagenome]